MYMPGNCVHTCAGVHRGQRLEVVESCSRETDAGDSMSTTELPFHSLVSSFDVGSRDCT